MRGTCVENFLQGFISSSAFRVIYVFENEKMKIVYILIIYMCAIRRLVISTNEFEFFSKKA